MDVRWDDRGFGGEEEDAYEDCSFFTQADFFLLDDLGFLEACHDEFAIVVFFWI